MINAALVLFTIFLLTFGFYLSQNNHLKELKAENAAVIDDTSYLGTLSEAQKINEASNKVIQITSRLYYPQEIVNKITAINKNGIEIKSYKINFDSGDVTISGISTDRLNLIDFKTNLEKDEVFSVVTLPLKNLESETNLEFTMNLKLASIQKEEDTGTIKIENPAE